MNLNNAVKGSIFPTDGNGRILPNSEPQIEYEINFSGFELTWDEMTDMVIQDLRQNLESMHAQAQKLTATSGGQTVYSLN